MGAVELSSAGEHVQTWHPRAGSIVHCGVVRHVGFPSGQIVADLVWAQAEIQITSVAKRVSTRVMKP